jgi:hypothetical protein
MQLIPVPVSASSRRRFLARSLGTAGALSLLTPKRAKAQWVGPLEVVLNNTSRPSYSPNLCQGDGYEFTILAPPGSAVQCCTQINGGSWTCTAEGTTDAMGQLVVTGQAGLIGQYQQTWYGNGQQYPLHFWVYAPGSLNYGAINQQAVQALLSNLNTLSGNPTHPPNWTNFGSASSQFFSLLSTYNLTSLITNGLAAASSVPPFSGNSYQNLVNSTKSLLSWANSTLSLQSPCQPSVSQVQGVNSSANWGTFTGAHIGSCGLIAQILKQEGYSRLRRLPGGAYLRNASAITLSAGQAAGIGALGGVGISGGYALTNASGVDGANVLNVGSGLGAATWWTGVGLIVVGVAWATYWGYQAWTAAGGNTPPAPNVGGCDCDIDEEWEMLLPE